MASCGKVRLNQYLWLLSHRPAPRQGSKKTSRTLTKVYQASRMTPVGFVDSVASIHRLLLEGQISAHNLNRGDRVSFTCPAPPTWKQPCTMCVKYQYPCLQVSGSKRCVACAVKKAVCNRPNGIDIVENEENGPWPQMIISPPHYSILLRSLVENHKEQPTANGRRLIKKARAMRVCSPALAHPKAVIAQSLGTSVVFWPSFVMTY